MKSGWIGVLALALSIAPQTGAAADDKQDKWAGIDYSKVEAEGSSIAWGKAVGVVDEPFDEVLAVVQDYANYSKFLPRFRKSKVLAQRGNKAMVYLEVGVMKDTVTLWGQMRMAEKPADGETRVIEANLVEGNMGQFKARWELTPVNGGQGARVDFRVLVDPDMPLPASVFTWENVKAARKTVRALKQRVRDVRG